MTRIPIRLRVAAAFALAMAIVLTASGWFLYARLGARLDEALARDLRLRAQDLTALVQHGGSLDTASGGRLVERGEAYAELVDAHGRVLDATEPLGRRRVLDPADVRRALTRELTVDLQSVPGLDEPSRVLATPVTVRGDSAVLAVGATRQDRAETLASLRDLLLVAGPAALVLATLAGYLLAGVSLRPVESMRRRAAEISGEDLATRLPVPRSRDELERLGTTLNAMLLRIEEVLKRERALVADAGHELRTPLALLRTELELALRHEASVDELKNAIRRASQEVDRLTQLTEGLLLIARTDQGHLPLRIERVEASTLLTDVAARFGWRAEEAGRAIGVAASDRLELNVDRIRVEQALGNLVDNALRHGAGQVRLSAVYSDERVELHVTDEGGGFDPKFVEQAFERFTRPDYARSERGSGLGLSIVKAIAEAHGGSARIGPGRPTDVWLALPVTQTNDAVVVPFSCPRIAPAGNAGLRDDHHEDAEGTTEPNATAR